MRTVQKNKTAMKYATYITTRTIFQTDDNGDIEHFTDTEGNIYPMDTSEYEDIYGNIGDMMANISLSSNDEGVATPYGLSTKDFSAILVLEKGYPVKKGDYIWVNSPIEYEYNGEELEFFLENGEKVVTKVVKVESADYQVVGVPDSKNIGKILLKSVNK